jgi:hypothetical protein
MTTVEAPDRQVNEWELLYARITGLLSGFGKEDWLGNADYWVLNDNWGTHQHKVLANQLAMLRPHIVNALQNLLADLPDWEIVVAVSLGGPGKAWPPMGLIIRAHEIVDGLERQYFPAEFQGLAYTGSRPGTDRD